jgi:ABC-type transporter Mla subunit MlaD
LILIRDLLTIAASECRIMPDPTSVSADIIPFPQRRPASAIDDGQERLRRALLALDAAVTGQRAAVAAWRSTLAELGTVMAGLGESMQRYRGSLDTLGSRVAGLNAQAVQLERTADAALAVSSD